MLKNWQADQNFPYQGVTALAQSGDGYLWIGTPDGLLCFDGFDFQLFSMDNVPAFRNNFVSTFISDRQNRLWLIIDGRQLVMFDREKWYDFKNPAVFIKNKKIYPTPDMNVLFQDRIGTLWIGTEGGGLLKFHNNQIKNYNADDGLTNERITCIAEDSEGHIWFGTRGGGLGFIRHDTVYNLSRQNGLSSDYIMHICFSHDGSLWIGSNESGIGHYQNGRFRNYGHPKHLSANSAVFLLEDAHHNVWVGTVGGGLNRLSGGKFSLFDSRKGFPGDVISCLLEDRDRNLWIGTSGAGLVQLRDGRVKSLTIKEGLAAQNICPIFQSADSTIYIGTFGGGFTTISNHTMRHFNHRQGINNNILSFAEDHKKRIWVGSYGGGVYVLEGNLRRNYNRKNGLSTNLVKALSVDRDGKIWVGTDGGGINIIGEHDIVHLTKQDGLPGDNINFIHQMRNGEFWIGTDMAGLCIYDGRQFKTYTSRDGLSANTFFSVQEDPDGHIWLASYKGITHYHPDLGFTAITAKQGLFDYSTSRILEDDDHFLWLLTSKGLVYTEKKRLLEFVKSKDPVHVIWKSLGQSDGMVTEVGSEYCHPAGWKMHNGELWFATVKGVVIVEPGVAKAKPAFPDVRIRRLTADQHMMDLKEPVLMSSDVDHIEIEYTALQMALSGKIHFKYRLDGFDRNWIEAKQRRVAFYNNLSCGSYRFVVRSGNTDGDWNENEVSLLITIEPRYYETPLFYLLMALFVLGLIFTAYRLRVRHLRQRELMLQSLVNEKTAEVNRQKSQLEMTLGELQKTQLQLIQSEKMSSLGQLTAGMAHEINNPLSFVQGNLEYLSDIILKQENAVPDNIPSGKELANALQSSLYGVKRISDVLQNLKNFSKIEQSVFSEIYINEDLDSILGLFFAHIRDVRFVRKYDSGLAEKSLPCFAGEINLALKNILMNALYAIRDAEQQKIIPLQSGQIIIETKLQSGWGAEILITDNGIGIPEENLPKIFDPFFTTRPVGSGKGLGLSEAYGIIQKHGGTIDVRSVFMSGTTFTIRLKTQIPNKE